MKKKWLQEGTMAFLLGASVAVAFFGRGDLLARVFKSTPRPVSLAKVSARRPASVSPPQIQTTAQSPDPDDLSRIRGMLQSLQACLTSHRCDFPKDDPHAYSFAVGKAAESALADFTQEVKQAHSVDPRITDLAVSALQWEDDSVRSAALDLLATQPPSPRARDGILAGLGASHDDSLYNQGLNELRRYGSAEDQQAISEFLERTIQMGPFFAANTVANGVLPFLTAQNLPAYRKILAELPPGSAKRAALEQALFEFTQR